MEGVPAAPAAAPTAEGDQPAAPVAVANAEFSAIAKAKVESIKTLPAEKAYDVVIEENSVEAYEEFIRAYPEDPRVQANPYPAQPPQSDGGVAQCGRVEHPGGL